MPHPDVICDVLALLRHRFDTFLDYYECFGESRVLHPPLVPSIALGDWVLLLPQLAAVHFWVQTHATANPHGWCHCDIELRRLLIAPRLTLQLMAVDDQHVSLMTY